MNLKLEESGFTDYLITKNDIGKNAFEEWLFHLGMLFNSKVKWWVKGERDKPHEGLDLYSYRDSQKKIHFLNENLKIPAIYDGTVVGIIKDFIGESIIFEHRTQEYVICTIFGHTIPVNHLGIGSQVKQGEIVALLADAKKSKAKTPSHLHISIGFPDSSIFYENINWNIIGNSNQIKLIDPLPFICPHYDLYYDDLKIF